MAQAPHLSKAVPPNAKSSNRKRVTDNLGTKGVPL
jgi:hypothetical protein